MRDCKETCLESSWLTSAVVKRSVNNLEVFDFMIPGMPNNLIKFSVEFINFSKLQFFHVSTK